MSCHDIRLRFHAFHDGALAPDVADRVESHLSSCPACAAQFANSKALESSVRAAIRQEQAPAGLSGRIRRAIGRSETPMGAGGAPRRLLRTPRLAGAFALAAALLIVVVLGVQSDNDRETGSMLLAEAPVDELRSFIDSNRPLDLASIDPSTAQRWLASRVEFSVPEAPRAAKTALTGARLCFFLGRRVAAYMYDSEGQPVSLYIMADTGLAMPSGISGNRPSHIAADGAEEFAHILWMRDGLLFSLVAPLPAERLMPLAQTLSASPRQDGAGI